MDARESPAKEFAASPDGEGAGLRIALISYSLPREGTKRGGIERIAHDLAEGLALRGHAVTVWSYDEAPDGAPYRVRRLPFEGFATNWLGLRLTMGYLGNAITAMPDFGDAEVILTMGDSLLLPLRRRPVIRVMHGSALGEAMSATSPLRFVMQFGVYLQELVTGMVQPGTVAVSENTRRHNPFVRRVIPNGVDLSSFTAEGPKAAEPMILFVGTLDGRKRGRLLLQWFAEKIRPRHPNAKLVFVGPQGDAAEGVEYRTGVPADELARLYREAWVYASPSSYEGFGLPYVEAMASGTPVIATPNPGSREVLEGGRYGVLVEDDAFADEVLRLLDDPAERHRLAELGIERAKKYSKTRMIDGYEDLIRQFCRSSTQRRGHER